MIAYVNASNSWNREERTFALSAPAYPGLDLSLTRDQAVTALVTAYFHRYGPAAVRDAAWWSGLPATDIVTVSTPWSTRPCLTFADQVADAVGYQETAACSCCHTWTRSSMPTTKPGTATWQACPQRRVQPDRRSPKLGEEVGELYRSVRKLQGSPQASPAGPPTSATKPSTR